jgi:hypothetical protein
MDSPPRSEGALQGALVLHRRSKEYLLPEERGQLETGPDDPCSVNTWIGSHDGRLYVPTSLILGADEPLEREWVRNVEADPRVRVRIDGTVYELLAVRVEDAATLEAVRATLLTKYEEEADDHARNAWIYELARR